MKRLLFVIALLLIPIADAVAQWQVPTGNYPRGRGAGVTGFTSEPGDGFLTGVINAKTANYTLATTDCGKSIVLGGSAFYTLTVGAASGFPATCGFIVVNTDTAAGKAMAVNGITVGKTNILWPEQGINIRNVNNTWVVVGPPARWILRSTTAFFVDASLGNDNNDGLAAGTGRAWASLQKAVNTLCGEIDANLNLMTFTFAFGAYTKAVACQYPGYSNVLGYGQATFQATPTTVTMTIASPGVVTWTAHGLSTNATVFFSTTGALPTGFLPGVPYFVVAGAGANTFSLSLTPGGAAINTSGSQSGVHSAIAPMKTTISGSGGSGIAFFGQTNTPMMLKGFQFISCSTFCIEADNQATIALDTVDFGSTGNHVASFYGSSVVFVNNGWSTSTDFDIHWYAQYQSRIFAQPGKTMGIAATPSVLFFAFADAQGIQNWTGTSFVGTATGTRCQIISGSGIATNTGSATFLPGNSGCTATGASFGWYNYLLKRDLDPANDNSPMWINKAA